MLSRILCVAALLLTTVAHAEVRPETPKIGDPPEALNMRLVGYDRLQAPIDHDCAADRAADRSRKQDAQDAQAYRDAQRLKGDGDAKASAIYARAFERNPEFYAFYRSLQAYERSLGKDGDLLVVTPDGEFFKYLKDPSPGKR